MKDGIIYTKSLELDALEVQFVRGIRMTEEEARDVGSVAREADVELHVHAPYYTNLAGDEANVQMSMEKILAAANLAEIMGAKTVVVHPGFYGDLGREETTQRVVANTAKLRDAFRAKGWKVQLGLETMGKKAVFGDLDEVLGVCRRVPGVVPVLDFGHIHARSNGGLVEKEDFQAVFDRIADLKLEHFLIHFTGVLYEDGNERHHLPIKKGDLRFEPLVDVILDNEYHVTLISESPILEHDAMYMQIVFDRVKEKREQKLAKEVEEAARKPVLAPTIGGASVLEKAEKAGNGRGLPAPRVVKKVAKVARPAKAAKPAARRPAPKAKARPKPKKASVSKKGGSKPSRKSVRRR